MKSSAPRRTTALVLVLQLSLALPALAAARVRRQQQQPPPPPSQRGIAGDLEKNRAAQQGQAALAELPARQKRWALVIGVDQYRDAQIGRLNGAANDARLLSDALVRYAGFPADQVILLATDQPEERQPTRVNVLRRLSNLTSVVPADGLLLVSFAGHGMERGGQAYLLPSDAQMSEDVSFLEDTAVSVSRLKDRIRATGVRQVLVLLDACRNDPGGRADAPNPMTSAFAKFNFDVRNREVQAFATVYATAVGQRAYEYSEKKQGYFTWALVEGLKGGAANERGEVTLARLISFIQDTVPKRIGIDLGAGKQQRPFAVVEGYRAEELVLTAPGAAQAAAAPAAAEQPAPAAAAAAFELSYWDSIKGSANPEDFESYLRQYPNGVFAALARNRLKAPAAPEPVPAAGAPAADLTDTVWQGPLIANGKQEGFLRVTFLKGNVYREQPVGLDKSEGVPLLGTWTQSGDQVSIGLQKTKSTSRGMTGQLTLKGRLLEGTRTLHGGPYTNKPLAITLELLRTRAEEVDVWATTPVSDVADTTWKGEAYFNGKLEAYIRLTFLKGGVMQEHATLVNGSAAPLLEGTWTQSGDVVKVEIAKTKTVRGMSGVFTLKGNTLDGVRVLRGGPATDKPLPIVLRRMQR